MIFHKHDWVRIKETYAPPPSSINNVTGLSQDALLKLSFGVTTILWQCYRCKQLRKEEMLGKENK